MSTESIAESLRVGELPCTAQLILGADKRNPIFSVYRDSDREELQVYFGFELLETLADIPESPACKLLLARLYNAGVKVKSLCETFGFDPKTIRRWGQALRRGDAEGLIGVLEGRSSRRKLTAPVESFVRLRLPELLAQRRYGAVKRLRQEIQSVFRIQISARSLGPLIGELKTVPLTASVAELSASQQSSAVALESGVIGEDALSIPAPGDASAAVNGPEAAKPIREIASDCWPKDSEGVGESNPLLLGEIGDEAGVSAPENNAKLSPSFQCLAPQEGHCWCNHAGLLMFAESLIELSACVKPAQPVLSQWLGSLLLGAQNIEQTKFLNWEDLELMLGQVIRFPAAQRGQLKTLGTEATLAALFTFNAGVLGGAVGADFYFDPHTKHYTGEQNVLKGWCAKIRWADKILQPFKKAYDNYRDDHDLFRQLTLSAGVLRWTGQEVEVHVLPHVNYSAPVRNIIQTLMGSLNQKQLVMPDGSGRKLRFRLARKEEISVRIQTESSSE